MEARELKIEFQNESIVNVDHHRRVTHETFIVSLIYDKERERGKKKKKKMPDGQPQAYGIYQLLKAAREMKKKKRNKEKLFFPSSPLAISLGNFHTR